MHGAISSMAKLYEIGEIVGYVDLIDRTETGFKLSSTARWFCAVTNPNCQARASLGLYELGYRTFYPKARRWVSHARTRIAKEKPLLGRYIFVELDPKNDQQSFGAIRGVNGIEGIVGPMGIPTPFPSHWVETFRRRQMAGEWDEISNGPIPVGARIKIMEGEFAKQLAVVTRVKRGWVSCKIKDRNQYVKQALDNVRAA